MIEASVPLSNVPNNERSGDAARNAENGSSGGSTGDVRARVNRFSKYRIAIVLAVIAIGFYALSIISIVYTRGGAG